MEDIEQTVTALLAYTKDLLNQLTLWADGKCSAADVRETYDQLARQFDLTAVALESASMSMIDLAHIPDALRDCLDACLAKEASTSALEEHLPPIRDTILLLLQGLKRKQSLAFTARRPPPRQASADQVSPISPSEDHPSGDEADTRSTSLSPQVQRLLELEQKGRLIERPPTPRQGESCVFLKHEDRVKKVMVQGNMSLEELKGLIRETFNIHESLSSIYIRDPITLITYELQDVADVRPSSLLSTQAAENIMSRAELDLKLGAILTEVRRLQPRQPSSTMATEPTTISRDNLSQLRQDLVTARRLVDSFRYDTIGMLRQLRTQMDTWPSRQADTDDTRERTEAWSARVTSQLESFQDKVDEIKKDVVERRRRPNSTTLDMCDTQSEEVRRAVAELSLHLQNLRPRWKKMWEGELQRIVQEQQFLKDQEALVVDLQEDQEMVSNILTQLHKMDKLKRQYQQQQYPLDKQSTYHVPPAQEGFEGMASVLKQLMTIDVDHQRRVAALEQAEKMRARELANRIDAFEQELVTFVCSNKLKDTGGPQQVEWQRQKQNEILLKKLYKADDHDVVTAATCYPVNEDLTLRPPQN